MEYSNVLPEGFDGRFFFTNPSDEDFIGSWDSKGYLYPARSTTQMVIMNASPIETQNIRKKFAKELAEREFFKSEKAKEMEKQERPQGFPVFGSIHQGRTYSENDLKDYIQKCLDPMPISAPVMQNLPPDDIESRLHKDEEGFPISQVASQGQRLVTKENVRPQI